MCFLLAQKYTSHTRPRSVASEQGRITHGRLKMQIAGVVPGFAGKCALQECLLAGNCAIALMLISAEAPVQGARAP
jgi:hypothetical protein